MNKIFSVTFLDVDIVLFPNPIHFLATNGNDISSQEKVSEQDTGQQERERESVCVCLKGERDGTSLHGGNCSK